jgi:transposase
MRRYIGLDVHAASCTLAVISQAGKRLKDFPVETNGEALVEAIRMIPGRKHLVFEEGLQSAWLYETLSPHVDETVVAGITESRGQKDDRRDAYGLAEKLRSGTLEKRIFKAPRQFSVLRELSRIHITAAHDLVRVQLRIKSLYRSRGIRVSGGSVYSARHRDPWQERLPGSVQMRATRLYEQFDFLAAQKKQAERHLLGEARKHPIVRMLETAPGFGPIRSARLVPIVVTPHRFRTKRQFWSYCGLGIVMRSSSDWVQTPDGGWIRAPIQQTRGLSRQYNRGLKDIFKGAATTVITQQNKDAIYADYRSMLDSGIKPSLAKLTLARKIAATVLRMWKDEEEYQPEKYRRPRDTHREA